MKQYIDTVKEIEKELAVEYGRLNLFGLFERDDLKNKWDVLFSVAIKWKNKKDFISKVITKFSTKLEPEALFKISRFIYLEPDDAFVLNINMLANVENSDVELNNCRINDLFVGHAIILSSFRQQ